MATTHVMTNVRKRVEESGLTQQVIGERMGYAPGSARQSVSLFLKSRAPRIDVLLKFAQAMGIEVSDLLRPD